MISNILLNLNTLCAIHPLWPLIFIYIFLKTSACCFLMPGPTGVPLHYFIWWSRSPISKFCLPNYSVSNCTKKIEELRKISKIKLFENNASTLLLWSCKYLLNTCCSGYGYIIAPSTSVAKRDSVYIRSVSSKTVAISSEPTKNWNFSLKNAVKLINSHGIVFLQSYVNFQEVNLDGKLRKKNTKRMHLGFPPLFKCSHLILTHVAWNNLVFWDSTSNSGARKC